MPIDRAETDSPSKESQGIAADFGNGFVRAYTEQKVGIQQLFGDQDAAERARAALQASASSESLATKAGQLVTDAAVFIGASALASKLPGVGKFAPLAVSAALGFAAPVNTGETTVNRLEHAAIGALSIGAMQYGPKALTLLGMKNGIATDVAKVGISGFAAGASNSELDSLVRTGHLAKSSDAALSGLAWAGTGAAFHTVGLGAQKLQPLGIGIPAKGQVFVVGGRTANEHLQFLMKNGVPYKFYDAQTNPFARRFMGGSKETTLILPDGKTITTPQDRLAFAKELGIPTAPKEQEYDVVIAGGGPAGQAAATGARSEDLSTLVLDPQGPGGQAGTTSRIENYIGFPDGVSGPELMKNATVQSLRQGAEIAVNGVKGVERLADGKLRVDLLDGSQVEARTVVLATGVQPVELSGPGFAQFKNNGVFYESTMTQGPLTKPGEIVAVSGGGNSAGQGAITFADAVGPTGKVYLLSSTPLDPVKGKMSGYLIKQIQARPNIEVVEGARVQSVAGGDKMDSVMYRVKQGSLLGPEITLPANALHVYHGAKPQVGWLPKTIVTDDNGFLLTGSAAKQKTGSPWMLERDPLPNETSLPGVFTAGDANFSTTKRVQSATGDGGNTVAQLHRYLGTPEAAAPFAGALPMALAKAPRLANRATALWPLNDCPRPGYLSLGSVWSWRNRPVLDFNSTVASQIPV